MLEKVNHISFKTSEEAIMIAEFLKSVGFKIDKKYFKKDTYEWNFLTGFSLPESSLRYDGFVKYENTWRLTSDTSKIFSHSINGTCLIRKEKLKRLKTIREKEDE